jgi:dTDP-4-dehydrorhamnose reductase
MRFVVTGSNGLVGSRVCTLLEQGGHQVVGLGRGAQRTRGVQRYIGLDLTLEADVLNAIESATPDVIIHTASMTEVDACEKNPEAAYAANVTAAAAVAKGARKVGAHLVHVSTDYVFDGDHGPYDEEALPNPRGVYAVTKHMGEQAARIFVPGAAIARTAVVYGWPAAGRPNFGAWLVGALEKKQPLKLFEDQFVSASLADSVAAMVVELGARKLGGIWNTCCDAFRRGMRLQPFRPGRPPGAGQRCDRFEPFIRRPCRLARARRVNAVAAFRMDRAADDAGIVAAAGQQEGEFRR